PAKQGSYPVVFLTLYDDVRVASPRLRRCPSQGAAGPATVSPLRNRIPRHIGQPAPHRLDDIVCRFRFSAADETP
ncbi:MAG: hypothetical protein WCB44_18720, partial [Stellaceae bacterium]